MTLHRAPRHQPAKRLGKRSKESSSTGESDGSWPRTGGEQHPLWIAQELSWSDLNLTIGLLSPPKRAQRQRFLIRVLSVALSTRLEGSAAEKSRAVFSAVPFRLALTTMATSALSPGSRSFI